jgi:polyhydroxyalkanoate synthase subunit PhaC
MSQTDEVIMTKNEKTEEWLNEASEYAENMARVLDKSQKLWTKFLEQNQDTSQNVVDADPLNIMPSLYKFLQSIAENPQQIQASAFEYWIEQSELWYRMMSYWIGGEVQEPMATPDRSDKRFNNQLWSDGTVFDYIKQSYLLTSRWILETVQENTDDLSVQDRRKVNFYTRQLVEAMSPSNFAGTNPEIIEATFQEKGENLVRGLENMLEDLDRGKGKLAIRQTDMTAFKVGENIALSEGQVVFENKIFQLIQYAPKTETVYAKPLLFVPPWINKYYILDLNSKKSMVKYLTEKGYTVFMISWVNPDKQHKDVTFADYMTQGILTAIDKVKEETEQDSVNVVGYCIGGTLLGSTLAYLAQTDRHDIASATFFTTQFDFSDAGDLQVFTDEQTLKSVSQQMSKGYLEAQNMANAFNMLRASDLIWNYVVNNYMLGREPFPFDLLFWNADSTAMPAKVHLFYLQNFYKDNRLAQGKLELLGTQLDLSKNTVPTYHMAAKEDHIAPAASVYRGMKALGGKKRFILAGSGHIAGVVNPPAAQKYQYWIEGGSDNPTVETWQEAAKEQPGSWWNNWETWLRGFSGVQVTARQPGKNLTCIEPAPGRYVRQAR